MTDNLGPMPDPEIEPAPENPGGVDAINDDVPFAGDDPEPVGRDLDPEQNPGVEDQIPEGIAEPEDKQQEGESDGASEPEKEDPA